VAVPGGSFAEFDVLIPQDTKPGVYQLGFKTGVKKNANGGKITETYAQNELEDLDIALKECSVIIEPESLRGDVNCDGQVDIHDAKYALDYDVQFNRARLQKTDEDLTSTLHTPYIHTAMEAANVDHESELNSKDALAILKYSTLKMAGLQQDWKTIFPDE
jgi:hypothetical protein